MGAPKDASGQPGWREELKNRPRRPSGEVRAGADPDVVGYGRRVKLGDGSTTTETTTLTRDEYYNAPQKGARRQRGAPRRFDRCQNMWCDKKFLNEDKVSREGRCAACDQYWRRKGTERPRHLIVDQQQREYARAEAEHRAYEAQARREEWALRDQCTDCGAEVPERNKAGRCPKCAKSFYKTGRPKDFDYAAYQARNAEADEDDLTGRRHEYGSYDFMEPANPHDPLAVEEEFASRPDYDEPGYEEY